MPDKDHPQFVDCGMYIINPDKVKYFYLEALTGEYHVVLDDGENINLGKDMPKEFFYYLCNPSKIPWDE